MDDGIRNSYNIIMVLFEGIGDKIKSDSDIFVQEIEHAQKYEKPIIPFFLSWLWFEIYTGKRKYSVYYKGGYV